MGVVYTMELNDILAMLREEKNMKQQEVAEKVHVTKSAISSYETGSSQPSYSVLSALADYYNVSVDFLLGRTQLRLPIKLLEQNLSIEHNKFPIDLLYNLSCADKDLVAKIVIALDENQKFKNKK